MFDVVSSIESSGKASLKPAILGSLQRVSESVQVFLWVRSSYGTDVDNSEMASPSLGFVEALFREQPVSQTHCKPH